MDQPLKVLIIEDDFWIAGIHKEIVEKIQPFYVMHTAKSAEEALQYLCGCEPLPDLVLLDIYIPDMKGLALFFRLRTHYPALDIIIVSAANDKKTIVETKRAGAFDYIIKPVDQSRLNQALYSYVAYQELIDRTESFDQQDVDRLFRAMPNEGQPAQMTGQLPKGIDPLTLQEILGFLATHTEEPIGATAISQSVGASRSTVRRYMEYLVSIRQAEAIQHYGGVGRPLRQYIYRGQNEQNAINKE
ncbi:response regulator [Sporosarcina sp. Te-1]|uniref:response regulator n=1 Tax=Sporosarcina sp. Te-1 TaxID=2818390 RepID=UPI001A9D9E94|nr:response regulator [Sporosarcina sp. Te-1]QTD39498.1 response regulator [Sporosarcina sp. Te-1]